MAEPVSLTRWNVEIARPLIISRSGAHKESLCSGLIGPTFPHHPGGREAEVTDAEVACCCRRDGPDRCQHGSGWIWRFHRGCRARGGLRGGVGTWDRECG